MRLYERLGQLNPKGPADSFDPNEPGVQKHVHRSGSFLYTDQYCGRYIAGGRGKGELDTGTESPRISLRARRVFCVGLCGTAFVDRTVAEIFKELASG